MLLRNGALKGGSSGQLLAAALPLLEEGVTLVFRRWTAMCLALEGQWGGPDSAAKAQTIYEETLEWFHSHREHFSDDLGLELEDSFEQDFNAKLEDGSSYEVAKVLVRLHDELLQGSSAMLDRLRSTVPAGTSSSRSERVDRDGTVMTGPGEATSSDSGSDGEASEVPMDTEASTVKQMPRGPVVDEEGFELVQRRRPRGGPPG